jgi:predicted metal-dependent phosphotriesterase family hydrolase
MSDYRDATYDYGLEPGEPFDPEELEDEPFDLAQPHVMTALGPIDPGALGFALHHEHVICRPPLSDPDLILDDLVNAASELEGYFATGGRAIVDMTTADYGRSIGDIRWVAQHVPVHLVLATGHHKDRFAAPFLGNRTVEEIAVTSIDDLTVGIEGSSSMAGVIKAGTSLNEITDVEERVLRAAARAHLATGAPISTHTERGTMAREQLAVLREAGVDPRHVIVGHLDHALDEPYLLQILETGAFVSFDQWSKEQYALDSERAAMTKRLVDAGFVEQLLISGDFGRQSKWLSYGGGPGYVFFIEQVPLMLMEAGLTAPQVRQIFIENPALALTIRRPSEDLTS